MNIFTKMMAMALITLSVSVMLPGISNAEDSYRFSMMPQFYPERIAQMTEHLIKYLENGCGKKITPVMTKNNTDYETAMKKGEVEIGYQNPIMYNNVSELHEVVAVGVSAEGGDKYRGLIIIPSDSPIDRIADLKGETVMIVGKNTVGGYLSPRLSLLNAGIDTDRDINLLTAADNKQENVIIAVSIGDVSAGFIRESALHTADGFIKPGSVKILTECAWLPGWAISLKKSLPPAEKQKIKELLTRIPENSPALSTMGLKGFKAADDSLYAPLKKLEQTPDKKTADRNSY